MRTILSERDDESLLVRGGRFLARIGRPRLPKRFRFRERYAEPEEKVPTPAEIEQQDIQTGWETEQRFLKLVTTAIESGKCPYIVSIRRTNKTEDMIGGYDFVITYSTTYGHEHTYEVAIDTKTSFAGAEHYRKKRGENGVIPVVAGFGIVDDDSIHKTVREIWIRTRKSHPVFQKEFY